MKMRTERKSTKARDFGSERKIARIAAALKGAVDVEETPAERSANLMFLSELLINLTVLERAAVGKVIESGERGVSARAIFGINEVMHCVAGNLRHRIGASTPNAWSLQDCLEDYEEVARQYGVLSILQNARAITEAVAPERSRVEAEPDASGPSLAEGNS